MMIYYSVESLFYRKDIGSKLSFLINNGNFRDSIHKSIREFKDESPIVARDNAFNHFQSVVDVLYDGLRKVYTTDEQARFELQKYFNSGNDVELMSNSSNKFKISDDIFNGIRIYLIVDELFPIPNECAKKIKFLIHSINYVDYQERVDEEIVSCIHGLIEESKYYNKYSYPVNDSISNVDLGSIGQN